MPGPGERAGIGFGIQGVGQALMQAAGTVENRQIMRREEEILRGREKRADQRLDLAERQVEQNRIFEEQRLAEQRRQAQRTNARYVADAIKQESRYADSLRMRGVEPQVMPGITSMPEPQFQGGVGSALMDVTRTQEVPESSMLRVPSVSAPADAGEQAIRFQGRLRGATRGPQGPRTTYDASRGMLVNLDTGEASPVSAGGEPVGARPAPDPTLDERAENEALELSESLGLEQAIESIEEIEDRTEAENTVLEYLLRMRNRNKRSNTGYLTGQYGPPPGAPGG